MAVVIRGGISRPRLEAMKLGDGRFGGLKGMCICREDMLIKDKT
jgi:hypothetical protein